MNESEGADVTACGNKRGRKPTVLDKPLVSVALIGVTGESPVLAGVVIVTVNGKAELSVLV